MKRVAGFLAGVAAVGAGVAAAAYYFQKKGVISINVSYENERGETVSRPLDALVNEGAARLADDAAACAIELAHSAADATVKLARAAKTTVAEQLESIDRQLRRSNEPERQNDCLDTDADQLFFGELEMI